MRCDQDLRLQNQRNRSQCQRRASHLAIQDDELLTQESVLQYEL